MGKELTIKDVSKKLNIAIDTLRYYDKIGLLSPKRAENKYRHYSSNDILKLQYIAVMKYGGFSLSQIKLMLQLLDNEPSLECREKVLQLLSGKFKEIEKAIFNYTNLLKLVSESIEITQKIDSYPEEHYRIDSFIVKIFEDIKE